MTFRRVFLIGSMWFSIALPSFANIQSPFETREVFSADVTPFTKWTNMLTRTETQINLPEDMCDQTSTHLCHTQDFFQQLETMQSLEQLEQIKRINRLANANTYVQDFINWGVQDFWETPIEFITLKGDCEDYAITKYYALRLLGIPAEAMRIIIVQDYNLGGAIHAILGVKFQDELILLDNQIKEVIRAADVYHYKPVYGINETGWWAYYPKS